jgi:thiol-disulfide isomerase/thioredoxin
MSSDDSDGIANIQQVRSKGEFALLYFGADWCNSCKKFKKDGWLRMLSKYGSEKLIYVDVDNHPDIQKMYKVVKLPTFIILNSDQEVVEFLIGPGDVEELYGVIAMGFSYDNVEEIEF